VLPRILFFYIIPDIYNMKDTVYIEEKEKSIDAPETTKKPVVLVLTISVVLILLLNLINTIIFY
jgi:hypothetical protein